MNLLKVAALAACVLFSPPAFAQEARGTVLNINAEGVSEARPDIATIELGVRTGARTAEAALEENSRRIAGLMAALQREGVAERDIQTEALSLRPNREGRVVTNYRAVNSLEVRVRDISATSRIVQAAVNAGGNTVDRISFGFADPVAQADIARSNAIAEARRRAELYARSLGQRVVRAVSVSEPGAVRIGAEQLELTATLTTESLLDELPQIIPAVIPVSPGEVETRASVSVSFELR